MIRSTVAAVTIAVIFLCTSAVAGTWTVGGGTLDQDSANIDMAGGRADNGDYNYGAATSVNSRQYVGATAACWLRPKQDLRTSGYRQDSVMVILYLPGAAAADTFDYVFYPMKKAWAEGNKTGATSATGESDSQDAVEGSLAWTATCGTSAANDYIDARIDSIHMVGGVNPARWDTVVVQYPYANDTLFDYGIIIMTRNSSDNTSLYYWYSDDASSNRPKFVGFESPTGIKKGKFRLP
jgi:hypothetical protein